jgi:xanthine dehydrogenase YagR molybdenum-binding subunit
MTIPPSTSTGLTPDVSPRVAVGGAGLASVAAAIGNALYHATRRRLRSLAITIDQLP